MLAVVVTDVEVEGEYQFERRQFGSNPEQLRRLGKWLLEQGVDEVVMESTAQYWKPVWGTLERYWQPSCKKREDAGPMSGTLHLAQAQSNRESRRTLSEPFSPIRIETCIIHTCKEYPGAQLPSDRCCSSRPTQKEDRKCNLRNLKSRLSKWSSAGASLESAVSSSNPLIVIRCANGIRSILDSLTKAKA